MTTTLTLMVDDRLLASAQAFATAQGTSVPELLTQYLNQISASSAVIPELTQQPKPASSVTSKTIPHTASQSLPPLTQQLAGSMQGFEADDPKALYS